MTKLLIQKEKRRLPRRVAMDSLALDVLQPPMSVIFWRAEAAERE